MTRKEFQKAYIAREKAIRKATKAINDEFNIKRDAYRQQHAKYNIGDLAESTGSNPFNGTVVGVHVRNNGDIYYSVEIPEDEDHHLAGSKAWLDQNIQPK